MMGKLIIHNETGFGDDEVLGLISEIIAEGRISNGGYCYVTVYRELGVVMVLLVQRKTKTLTHSTYDIWKIIENIC